MTLSIKLSGVIFSAEGPPTVVILTKAAVLIPATIFISSRNTEDKVLVLAESN